MKSEVCLAAGTSQIGRTLNQFDISVGDKLVIPARTLHAEGETNVRIVCLIAIPEPVGEDEFLVQLSPDDL